MSLTFKTPSGAINVIPEDGTGNNDVSIPRAGFGNVIQVQAVQTKELLQITTTDLYPIPYLEIDFTPVLPNSKWLLDASVAHNKRYVASLSFLADGATIDGIPDNTNGLGLLSTMYDASGNVTTQLYNSNLQWLYTPHHGGGTIKIQVAVISSWSTGNYAIMVNDRSTNDSRSFSSLRIWELNGV